MFLTILSALLGFFGPFIPELIKTFRQKQDNAHEISVLKLQAEASQQNHLYKMEEIGAISDITKMTVLHQPVQSFGVQLLDATQNWPKFVVVPVFYLFAFLDFVSGFVRPGVTYSIVGFYLFYKWAIFDLARLDSDKWQVAVQNIWTENDWAVLLLVLGFYFGQRTVKATFGGSTSTGKAGGG
jgi:hypothetical protein